MPPEAYFQSRNTVNDPRFDIYSLGMTLLELIMGKHPLSGLTDQDNLAAKLGQTFIPQSLPLWVQEVFLKALHPQPEIRFQTMSDFKEAMIAKSAPFVLSKSKRDADEFAAKAEFALKHKRWNSAKRYIDESLRSSSDCIRGLIVAGRYSTSLNRMEKAKQYFQRALTLNPRAEVQKELGWVYLEEPNYPLAISMLSDYLHRYSSDSEALNLL